MLAPLPHLTPVERDLVEQLADVWNLYVTLDNRGEDDDMQFMDAIHTAQQIIALRVARRVDPDIWRQPT